MGRRIFFIFLELHLIRTLHNVFWRYQTVYWFLFNADIHENGSLIFRESLARQQKLDLERQFLHTQMRLDTRISICFWFGTNRLRDVVKKVSMISICITCNSFSSFQFWKNELFNRISILCEEELLISAQLNCNSVPSVALKSFTSETKILYRQHKMFCAIMKFRRNL